MNYDEWIERERKIRISILLSSPLIQRTEKYRTCRDCGEICLCHENACPNCNANTIIETRINKAVVVSGEHIRCIYRHENLIRY